LYAQNKALSKLIGLQKFHQIHQPKPEQTMTQMTPADNSATQTKKTKVNGAAKNAAQASTGKQARQGRAISDPREVAQLVMMRIDQVNSKKDELTIAVKALADTAKQLVSIYAGQQAQIAKLAKRVEELEKTKG
jgi:ABC-type transporter Mla subunit MlaD